MEFPNLSLRNEVAAVSVGRTGVGQDIALAPGGADFTLAARRTEPPGETAKQIGGPTQARFADDAGGSSGYI